MTLVGTFFAGEKSATNTTWGGFGHMSCCRSMKLTVPISAEDFRTLNRCLDDAIAGAVTEFARQERVVTERQSAGQSVALQNLLYTAITAFEVLQTGTVGIGGNTGTVVHRSLVAMRSLI